MRFSKYHGAGNDFVMLADPEGRLGPRGTLAAELVRAICDRHTGVGADGVIRVLPSETSARYMDYYNADGSTAEMCGNGIRCLVLHEQDAGRLAGGDHEIETPSRVVTVKGAGRGRFTVDMGLPGERAPVEVSLDGDSLAGSTVSMGNPHLVLFCDVIGRALDDGTVRSLGPRLETHPDFPERTNVEFVDVANATTLEVRVWERGVGETMACGSGVCAAAVAAASLQRTGPHVLVRVPGGELEVEWEPSGHVWLTGPAERVFDGEIDRGWLEARGLSGYVALVAP
jgi:diaminopimelate epimerase